MIAAGLLWLPAMSKQEKLDGKNILEYWSVFGLRILLWISFFMRWRASADNCQPELSCG